MRNKLAPSKLLCYIRFARVSTAMKSCGACLQQPFITQTTRSELFGCVQPQQMQMMQRFIQVLLILYLYLNIYCVQE
jgi:hypothetical protein